MHPTLKKARTLAARFRKEGYRPGAPAGLANHNLATDRAICRRLRCPGCGKRTMRGRAWHNREGGYRMLAKCLSCHAGEER